MVWVDVETTGLDPERDFLLEVGVTVTSGELEILGSLSAVINNGIAVSVLQSLSNDFVCQMHSDSKLWDHVHSRGTAPEEAEASLLSFLSKYVEPGSSPMCGSTVGFDRAFLKKHMPKLEAFFHYRNIDVSTIKELARLWNPVAFKTRPDEVTKIHRALSDILCSVNELHHYRLTFMRLT